MSLATYLQEAADGMYDHPFDLAMTIKPHGLELRMSDDNRDYRARLHVQRCFSLRELDLCQANPLPLAIERMIDTLRRAGAVESREAVV